MVQLRTIEAEVETPPVVEVPAGAKQVEVTVRVSVSNTGEEPVVVHAESGDGRVFWHVFDANHREVQRERGRGRGGARATVKDGVHSFRTETVAPGHAEHATRALQLDARKLKPGGVYTVRAEFFGHVAESQFAVIAAPAPPSGKAAAAARPRLKRGGGKMAVARKPAKKTAKKTTAKKTKKAAGKKTAKKTAKKARKKAAARRPRRKAG